MDDITRSNSLADLLSRRGEGIGRNQRIKLMQKQIAHASQPAVWSARDTMPITRDAERPLPDAWRTIVRRSEGQ